MVDQNNKAFFTSWADTMLAQSDLVRNLIGDRHWLSDGHHKEYLIRDAISKYIPSSAIVASGFIKPQRPEVDCSKELDILIFDSHSHTPYLHQNGLAIVTPSSVIAHIEIKSTFSKQFMKDAVLNVITARSLSKRFSSGHDLWSGICVFQVNNSRTIKSIAKTISNSVSETILDPDIQQKHIINSVNLEDILPTCIFSVDGFIAFLRLEKNPDKLHVQVYQSDQLSSALVFSDLFGRIRKRFGGDSTDDISNLLLDICGSDTRSATFTQNL